MYGKLQDSDQKTFNEYKNDYTPFERSIALYIKTYVRPNRKFKPIYFEWAVKLVPVWRELERDYFLRGSVKIGSKHYTPNGFYSVQFKDEDVLEKELRFQGFVPLDEYEHRVNHDKFGYFRTNRFINGKKFIYPKKFCDKYDSKLRKKYPFYEKYMGHYGVPGIIQYWYSDPFA